MPGVNGEEEREHRRGAHTGEWAISRRARRTSSRGTEPRKTKGTDTGHPLALPLAGTEPQPQQVGSSRAKSTGTRCRVANRTHAHLPAPSLFMRAARGPAAATARLRSAGHRRPINDSYTGRSGQVLGWKPGTKLRIGWLEDSRIVLGQEARLGLTCPLICFSFS